MKRKILLIDDDPLVLNSTSRFLQSKGYDVKGCKSGEEAIQTFKQERFDLVVSDIRMRDKDGVQTVKELREWETDQELSPIPIIMITGYASEDAPIEAIKAGVQDYFLKPFDSNQLLKSIETHLEASLQVVKSSLLQQPVRFSILGIGIVSPFGFTKEAFWKSINECKPFYNQISESSYPELSDYYCMRVGDFKAGDYFDEKQLHNLDNNSIFIAAAAKFAIQDSGLKITKIGSDDIGVSVGTSVSIAAPMSDFDESVLKEGYRRSKIGIFPNTVMCAPASRVSIFEHITGSNTTISSGMNSGIDAIGHASFCLEGGLAKIMVTGGSDALSDKILLGYAKEGLLLRQMNGQMRNKRGSFIPSEGACALVLGRMDEEHPEPQVYAEILSYECGFSPFNQREVTLRGESLCGTLEDCLNRAQFAPDDIDCILISSYFNEFDHQSELIALKKFFPDTIKKKLILAPKKIIGENFAAFAPQLVVFAVGLFNGQINAKAIEYLRESGAVPKGGKISSILIVHVDSGGHQSALALKSKED